MLGDLGPAYPCWQPSSSTDWGSARRGSGWLLSGQAWLSALQAGRDGAERNPTSAPQDDTSPPQNGASPPQDGVSPLQEIASAEERTPELRRLEAALFIARESLNSRRLAELAALKDGTQARTLIEELNRYYETRGRSFHVKRIAGGYWLMTRPAFAKWIRRLDHVPAHGRLTTPALETLAVIAYRQPLVRAEIDGIRGVNSGEILRQLMERDLVRICGRSQDLGRPFLYATTRHFLKLFGLGSLDDLPEANRLKVVWSLAETNRPEFPEITAPSAADLPNESESEIP